MCRATLITHTRDSYDTGDFDWRRGHRQRVSFCWYLGDSVAGPLGVLPFGAGEEVLEHQLVFNYYLSLGQIGGVQLGPCISSSSAPSYTYDQVALRCANGADEAKCPAHAPPDHVSQCSIALKRSRPSLGICRGHFVVKFCPGDVSYFNRTLGLSY